MIRKHLLFVALSLLFVSGAGMAQSSTPPLNPNSWNFVLVPTFENAADPGKNNNLSVTGLNHALHFAQLLNGLTAGKTHQLRQIYALTESTNSADMTPLESIEAFAVLNNAAVKAQTLNPGDASVYNSPGYFIQNIIANQPRGTYIMAMPSTVMREIVKTLTGAQVSKQDANHYLVVTGDALPFTADIYQDHIKPIAHYPDVPLPVRSACTQAPITIKVKKPAELQSYNAQSVYFVRHVEAHPNGNFENGNFVCQGQWRALGANRILLEKMHERKPDYIFTSTPGNIIDCGQSCSYIRPALTVAPFAIQHNIPLTLAPFQWEDATDLAEALFNRNSPYFNDRKNGASILVGWEHVHIEDTVKYLLGTVYRNPEAAAKVPSWSFEDYDSIWEITTDKKGDLEFKNSCEGIASDSLPSTCPAFFSMQYSRVE